MQKNKIRWVHSLWGVRNEGAQSREGGASGGEVGGWAGGWVQWVGGWMFAVPEPRTRASGLPREQCRVLARAGRSFRGREVFGRWGLAVRPCWSAGGVGRAKRRVRDSAGVGGRVGVGVGWGAVGGASAPGARREAQLPRAMRDLVLSERTDLLG